MNKEQKIAAFLEEPIKEGEYISFTGYGNGSQDKTASAWGVVTTVTEDEVFFTKDKQTLKRPINEVKKVVAFIGEDPFVERRRVDSYSIDIDQLLFYTGYESDGSVRKREYIEGSIECNVDPFVIDKDGNKWHFQRGLEWTTEQKVMLIDSIYLGIDIGKFSVRKRSFKDVEQMAANGDVAAFSDLIDGKQRVNAILSFVRCEFKDSNGFYFNDLSDQAQRKFLNYRNLQFCQLSENSTDKETVEQFLMVNHGGKPMSVDHIDFVKGIYKKL